MNSLTIIGMGLMGGSIAAALRKRSFSGLIYGVDPNLDDLNAATSQGLINQAFTQISAAVQQTEFIILCTPLDQIIPAALEAGQACASGTLMTDIGSVKRKICQTIPARLPETVTFIGSHPLAGREKQGLSFADPDLFDNKICVLTPDNNSCKNAQKKLADFWQSLGLRVVEMSAAEHDASLAQTSHLPHLLAATLVKILEEKNQALTASGFRDVTRIAGANPELWTEIMLENTDHLLDLLDKFKTCLEEFQQSLQIKDREKLKNLLQLAQIKRNHLNSDPQLLIK